MKFTSNILTELRGDRDSILQLLQHITFELVTSTFPNARKGGLVGLAAVSVGLGSV